jgi:hypothetical protein
VEATILRNFSFCVHFLVGPATRHQLKIYLFVGLELGPAVALVAAVA